MAYESSATLDPIRNTGVSTHEGHTISRKPDGTIEVSSNTIRARIPQSGEFDENLADCMETHDRRLLAMRLKEFSEVDKDSRRDWERRERAGMEMLGITDIEHEDEREDGHNMTHPALMEANTRFQANAIVELFPPAGPCETKILGVESPAKMARAKRIRTFMNHQLVDVDKGYFDDTDKMLMYLPMAGSAFRRAAQDFTTGLPQLRHVKATNFIAPYSGTDLESMPRYAWKFTMTGEDIDVAMRIGMFIDIYLQPPAPPQPGMAMHAPSADQSDFRVANLHERDRLYDMLEYHIELELDCDNKGAGAKRLKDGDLGVRPYIVVMDASNDQVLMVRRNWRKKDDQFKKRIWFAHHKFFPGFGFYGWGYCHVIGSVQDGASGSVNALLDSALAANFQGGFVSKESKIAGEFRLEHGVWQQCDSTAEDLQKSFFTPPFKEPSPALFNLLGQLVESIQRFAGTTDAAVGDGNNTGPVGTTIALIEQATKPQNAIHKRLHVSMSQELQMYAQLVEDFMGDRYDYNIGEDQQFLLKSDFAPGVDVICVTDPAISSDTQRVMRAQAVLELQEKDPSLYPPAKRAEAHRRMLVALKVPNVEAIAPEVKTPKYLDPVAENANIFAGMPVRVFPFQDDSNHIKIHQDGLQRAQALYPPEVFEKIIQPAMQAHIRDHMAKAYYKQMMQAAGLTPNFDQNGDPQGLDPQTEAQLTARLVQAVLRLPQPQPKAGTPSAEQQASQAKIEALKDESQARIDAKEQEFQAEERRRQAAFDNEERRKDQAMKFQLQRLQDEMDGKTTANAADHTQALVHKEQTHEQGLQHVAEKTALTSQATAMGHTQKVGSAAAQAGLKLEHADDAHGAKIKHGEEQHKQAIKHGDDKQQQALEQSGEAHDQGLEQGAESHEQQSAQSDESHKQSLDQAEKDAKAAASIEAEADSHMGGSVK